MKSKKALSKYAKGSAKVTISLFLFPLGLIVLFFNPFMGFVLLVFGIIGFIIGTIQKRELKNEMWEDALKDAKEESLD
jgi:cell shape-determining protein MreD